MIRARDGEEICLGSRKESNTALLRKLSAEGSDFFLLWERGRRIRMEKDGGQGRRAEGEVLLGIGGSLPGGEMALCLAGLEGLIAGIRMGSDPGEEIKGSKGRAEKIAERFGSIADVSLWMAARDGGEVKLLEEDSFRWSRDSFVFENRGGWTAQTGFLIARSTGPEESLTIATATGAPERAQPVIGFKGMDLDSATGARMLRAWEALRMESVAEACAAGKPGRGM